jgi:hypothetical protein
MRKLPHNEGFILDRYINSIAYCLADEGAFLYSSGFTDGIQAMKFISSLCAFSKSRRILCNDSVVLFVIV